MGFYFVLSLCCNKAQVVCRKITSVFFLVSPKRKHSELQNKWRRELQQSTVHCLVYIKNSVENLFKNGHSLFTDVFNRWNRLPVGPDAPILSASASAQSLQDLSDAPFAQEWNQSQNGVYFKIRFVLRESDDVENWERWKYTKMLPFILSTALASQRDTRQESDTSLAKRHNKYA